MSTQHANETTASRTLKTAIRAGGLFLAIAGLQGCIVLPVPQFPGDHQTFIEDETAELIQPEITARDEVRELLGEPQARFDDDDRWVYTAGSHRAGKLRICGAVADPFDIERSLEGQAGAAGCTDRTYTRVNSYLEIAFDDSDVVRSQARTDLKPGKCARSGLCRAEEGGIYVRSNP